MFQGKIHLLKSSAMILKLRAVVGIMGEERLGFLPKDVGTHSIRSGGAMAMYLDYVRPFTIMLIGRWKSDAFLKYIRRQVEAFSHNVSSRMKRNPDFFTTPDFEPVAFSEQTDEDSRRPISHRLFGRGASQVLPRGEGTSEGGRR